MPLLRLRRFVRRRLVLSGLTFLAGVFLLVCAYLTLQVYFRLDDLTAARSDNMQFTISRLEVDHVKLQTAAEALGGPNETATETFRRRFDAFYNRTNLLLSSPLYAEAISGAGMAEDLRTILASLDGMIALVDQPDAELVQSDAQLTERIDQLAEPIERIARASIGIDAAQSEAERHALAQTLLKLAGISLLLLAAFVALLLQLWTLNTRYRLRALENRTNLQRISTILNTSLDHILVVDADGRVIEANSAAISAFGLSQPLTGQTAVGDLLSYRNEVGATEPVAPSTLTEACRTGANRGISFMAHRADGTSFPAEMSAALAKQAGKTVCVCYLRDISARLETQKEIEAARDRALAGEQAQARFLAMISHEMRTPLNGMLGVVDLLEETKLTVEQRRYLRILQSAGQQLLTQINDALDLTQAGTGRLTLDSAVFDMDALLEEATGGLMAQARARDIRLELRIADAPLGLVTGDRARVLQVMVNLLSNAVKFTDQGQITVEAVRPDTGRPWIEVQVADTGRGIPEEDLPHIFEDFVRAGNIERSDVPGTGLGLGIVRNLVRAMGGSIGAESIEGEGSLFWVRLPLPAASGDAVDPVQPLTPVEPGETPGQRVLVVEDNPTNRFVITQMLLKDGHRVTEAENGEVALGLTQEAYYDLILMDMRMPGLDGLETARRIRASPGPARDARLIFLTAHTQTDTQDQFDAVGAEAVIAKPVRRSVLRGLLAGQTGAKPEKTRPFALDTLVLDQLRETLQKDSFDMLLHRFDREGQAFVATLDEIWQGPPETAIAKVHAFAGSAATFGAGALQKRLGLIETALQNNDIDRAKRLAEDMPALWSETRAGLSEGQSAA